MDRTEKVRLISEALALTKAHPANGAYAKDAHGLMTEPLFPDAVCWCGLGALRKVFGAKMGELPGKLGLDQDEFGDLADGIIRANDVGTEADLDAAFERLAEAAK